MHVKKLYLSLWVFPSIKDKSSYIIHAFFDKVSVRIGFYHSKNRAVA